VKVVLVHGAWHGAWCWEGVIAALADLSISAIAVDLPGHGADLGPLADLHGDADRVRQVLDAADGPSDRSIVLVGHSYGGAVVTEAGDHPAVAHLVYLCAFPLDSGESCANAAAKEAATATISHEGRPDLGGGMVGGPGGSVTIEPSRAAACLYNDLDDDTATRAVARLGPQSLLALQQTPDAVAWRTTPSTYVVCANDLAVHPDLQRLLAKRCTTTLEWQTGHSPFLSRPDLVAGLLAGLAGAAGDGPAG
jgi:pimeloyl-ACP methyl ester carboxylesterase